MLATSVQAARRGGVGTAAAARVASLVASPLQVVMAFPTALFLLALSAMLLRHPDVPFYQIDRVAFALLSLAVVGRALCLREPLFVERATWPMLGLTLLALLSLAGQPFDNEAASVLAAKIIVPFTLFHLAALVFTEERRIRQFEIFTLAILAYLTFTAIAFLAGANWLIFPRFILDESLGIHADRARGPMLQAVANGVSINLLGLLGLHAWRRGSLRGAKALLLLASVPLAILATMTRAVWLSFAGTVLVLVFRSKSCVRGRRVLVGLLLLGGVALIVVLASSKLRETLSDRFEERGPVDYREAVLAGSWQMFLERPLLGWGFHQMPAELPRFVRGYDEKLLYPHNTYMELLVEHGVAGLALYLWLMWELWRLRRGAIPDGEENGFLDRQFHHLWPILLGVYWLNAAVVVMSYQFVNGLLFTLAGMLAAQRRRAECSQTG